MGTPQSSNAQPLVGPKLAASAKHRLRVAWLVGVFAVLVLVAWLTNTPSRLCSSLAESALNQHQPHRAMLWVQRAIAASPGDGYPRLLAARAQLQLNKSQTANYWLDEAKCCYVLPETLSNFRTIVSAQTGNAAAIESLMKSDSTTALPPEAYEAIVRGLQLQGNFERAGLVLDELARTGSSMGVIHYLRGRSQEIQEDFPGALVHYQQALQVDPQSSRAAFRAGGCLNHQRNFDQATEMFRKLNAPPYAPIGSIEVANCLWELGQYDEAAKTIETTLSTAPRQLQSWYLEMDEFVDIDRAAMTAARIEDARGNSRQAIELLERVLAYNHRSFEGRTLLIKHLRLVGRSDEADQLAALQQRMIMNRQRCREIRSLLSDSPNNIELRCELAELYFETESEAEAQLLLQETLEIAPDNQRVKSLLAKINATHANPSSPPSQTTVTAP